MFCLLLWCPVKFDLVHVPLIFAYFKFPPHIPLGSCSAFKFLMCLTVVAIKAIKHAISKVFTVTCVDVFV